MSVDDYREPGSRQFYNLPVDTPPARFGPLAGFVAIWRGKWRGDRLPPWSAFDFYDFVGWHGLIYVDEVLSRSPLEMRCRLWGSGLVDLLGHDETGNLLSESPAVDEPGLMDSNRRIVGEATIGVVLGKATSYGRMTDVTVVKLPCADDGATVDHVLGCTRPDFLLDIQALMQPGSAG